MRQMVTARNIFAPYPRRRTVALQRDSQVNPRHIAEDANQHPAQSGSRRLRKPQGLRRGSAPCGIFAHAARPYPVAHNIQPALLGHLQHGGDYERQGEVSFV